MTLTAVVIPEIGIIIFCAPLFWIQPSNPATNLWRKKSSSSWLRASQKGHSWLNEWSFALVCERHPVALAVWLEARFSKFPVTSRAHSHIFFFFLNLNLRNSGRAWVEKLVCFYFVPWYSYRLNFKTVNISILPIMLLEASRDGPNVAEFSD